MESSWLVPVKGKYNITRWSDVSEGTRPSGAALMAMVDREDPAFPCIVAALSELKQAGIELDEKTVSLAIQLGQHRWSAGIEPSRAGRRSMPPVRENGSKCAIVYYVRRASVIKIGTTVKPRARFNALMPDEILAFEPGGNDLERERHCRFRHLRIGGTEHFRMAEDLLEHARTLRREHGDPDPSWPTMASLPEQGKGRLHLSPPPPAKSAQLVTATEGADECGIRRNTVHMWVHRGLLKPVGSNERGRALYLLDHVAHFAACSSAESLS